MKMVVTLHYMNHLDATNVVGILGEQVLHQLGDGSLWKKNEPILG